MCRFFFRGVRQRAMRPRDSGAPTYTCIYSSAQISRQNNAFVTGCISMTFACISRRAPPKKERKKIVLNSNMLGLCTWHRLSVFFTPSVINSSNIFAWFPLYCTKTHVNTHFDRSNSLKLWRTFKKFAFVRKIRFIFWNTKEKLRHMIFASQEI